LGAGEMLCAFAAPDGWILDQYLLDLPGRAEFQVALLADYLSNVELYLVAGVVARAPAASVCRVGFPRSNL